jgi:FMN phosphatase YigB (HAD superfamily)
MTAYIFDVVGTIIGTPGLGRALKSALAELGGDVRAEPEWLVARHKLIADLTALPARPTEEDYRTLNLDLLAATGLPALPGAAEVVHRQCHGLTWTPFPDATDTLAALSAAGCPVGVASNFDSTLSELLTRLFPGIHFEVILASGLGYPAKPRPEMLQLAAVQLGVEPAEATYVGDNPRLDGLAARAAGMEMVLVDRLDLYRAYPGRRIASLAELGPTGLRPPGQSGPRGRPSAWC